MIERCLKKVDFRLQKIALCLRDEKARREPDLVAALLDVEPLPRDRCAGACRLDAFGRAVHLPNSLAKRLGDLQLQTRDALRRLPAFDLRASQTGFLEAAPERVSHLHPDAPCRIGTVEHLSQHATVIPSRGTDDGSREIASAQKPRATEAVPSVRRFEADVGQLLIVEKLNAGRDVLQILARARQVIAFVE